MKLSSERESQTTTIGLFDSGVGGLSVLRQLQRLGCLTKPARSYRFIYLGDSARCPYGNRAPEEIREFVAEIVDWLVKQGIDILVMACNTSAALAGDVARSSAGIPVYDLISPTAEYVGSLAGKVVVMATASTVKSKAFSKAMLSVNPDLEIIEIPCPDLVPLVEQGLIDSTVTTAVLGKYAQLIEKEQAATVVLGCTHFPFLRQPLARLISPSVQLIDPSALVLGALLGISPDQCFHFVNETSQAELLETEIFVTGDSVEFQRSASACLGRLPASIIELGLGELTASRSREIPISTVVADSAVGV